MTFDPDQLLPPKFTVFDPDQEFSGSQNASDWVILPTADGGTSRINPRTVHVMHGDQRIELRQLTRAEKMRLQLLRNIVAVVTGLVILRIAFVLLRM